MAGIDLAWVTTPELGQAPEFRYLASWVRREAEAVFGAVRAVPAGEVLAAGNETPVLVVDGSTLLTRRSLQRMRRVAEERSAIAVACPLAETSLLAHRPVYTLRGFEELEELYLAESQPRLTNGRPVAALLVPAGAVRGALASFAPASWLDLPPELFNGHGVAAAGLCHRFADYYGQVREELVPILRREGLFRDAPGGAEVLEVGCGRGATGRLLQEALGVRVTGVELNPVVARAAREHLHRVVAGDFQEVAAELAEHGAFDGLLALELFEHLTDQEGFLDLARRLVRPGGWIVLSVPNVGHYSVVEDLLAGRWDYLPIGLLCYTHYRFFTRRTLEDWLVRCGFRQFRLLAQETELPERWRHPPDGMQGLAVDAQSLRTKGFYVIAETD
jgi:2-polyprenyl-3-methyl-5-hydroxy-6-metoxy-1,4-benzoquinol methylase